MILRKGKTKSILESAIECSLLAVEIYNKPRTPFRVESFITQMMMAWTRLLQAYFKHTSGDIYFYKEANGRRYLIVDGEKRAWDLKECIKQYGKLTDPVKSNLEFFIRLRNKIEHLTIDKDEVGIKIFGECQSLLYNFENELIKIFGADYAINESLAFSLQFSRIRTSKQLEAGKKLLSSEYKEIVAFIEKYRNSLSEDIFRSQEFSIKLIQVPKISNTNRNDLAIEFVNWESSSSEDLKNYNKLTTIIKDRVIKTEALNPSKLKPGKVLIQVEKNCKKKISHAEHKRILSIFSIRPYKEFGDKDPFDTNTKYCHYDEAHNDYLYQDSWINFLVYILTDNKLDLNLCKDLFDKKQTLDISDYEID